MEVRQILDLTPQLVAVYGPSRERLYANRVMLDYLGFGLEEWRRRVMNLDPPFILTTSERATSHFERAVSSAERVFTELELRTTQSRWMLSLVSYSLQLCVCDDNGQITRWYVACADIEDRKRAEQKLQQENVALREEIDKASMFGGDCRRVETP